MKGEPGEPGLTGGPGPRGPPGVAGVAGLQGLQGPEGVRGMPGPEGPPGKDGKSGRPGKEGPPGPKGGKGDRGLLSSVTGDLPTAILEGPPGLDKPAGLTIRYKKANSEIVTHCLSRSTWGEGGPGEDWQTRVSRYSQEESTLDVLQLFVCRLGREARP